MARVIDKDYLLTHKRKARFFGIGPDDESWGYAVPVEVIENTPALTPPNEPMLERVVREYLEICGEDCAGDPSVGIPECPFYQYADVMDNGALISTRCELVAYCRPPEGEKNI